VCSSHVGPYAGSFRQVQHSPLQECDLHKTCPHPAACVLYAVGSRASASRTLLNMSAVNSSAFFFFLTVSCLVCVYLCAVQWDPTSGASDNFHKPCYRNFLACMLWPQVYSCNLLYAVPVGCSGTLLLALLTTSTSPATGDSLLHAVATSSQL
jgi:hypothetical protein